MRCEKCEGTAAGGSGLVFCCAACAVRWVFGLSVDDPAFAAVPMPQVHGVPRPTTDELLAPHVVGPGD